jgi:hypothetical protein
MKTPPLPAVSRHLPATKPVPHHAPKPARGNMKPAEIKPLVLAARRAFVFQESLGNIDAGETFDTWRHHQCMVAVRRPGITSCHHEDFQPLLAHFLHLSGQDADAFNASMRGGSPSDHAAPGDTREARRHLVSIIADALAAHHHLATTPPDQLMAEVTGIFSLSMPGIAWENTPGPAAFQTLLDRRTAMAGRQVDVGYLVHLARRKTRRPNLTLGGDWREGLADRCTAAQLRQIRDTVVNRIAAIDGRGAPARRNKTQRRS